MRLRKRSRSGYRAINWAHSAARTSLPVVAHRRENLEDVNHIFVWLERDLHARLARALGQPSRVVEQSFRGADLDEQRRQSREVGIQRRGERTARILAIEVVLGH